MSFLDFVISCFGDLPIWFYIVTTIVFAILSLLVIRLKNIDKRQIWISRIFILLYVVLIYSSTVLFRPGHPGRAYNFQPFWSYRLIAEDNWYLLYENILNVLVFIPLGIALIFAFKKLHLWEALLIGGLFSFIIETSQYYLGSGFAETDDLIHNTLGCAIGYGIGSVLFRLAKNGSAKKGF